MASIVGLAIMAVLLGIDGTVFWSPMLRIHVRAYANDVEGVRRLARADPPSVHRVSSHRLDAHFRDVTPLQTAVVFGHLETTKALLALGADPNARPGDSPLYNPLFCAAYHDLRDIARLLVRHGASPHGDAEQYLRSPVYCALMNDDLGLLFQLIARGAPVPWHRDARVEWNREPVAKRPAIIITALTGRLVYEINRAAEFIDRLCERRSPKL